MASQMANVETVETAFRSPGLPPRARRTQAGRALRGDVAVEFATVPDKMPIRPPASTTSARASACRRARPLRRLPGAAARNVILRGSNLAELFAAGRVPLSADELAPREVDVIAAKSFSMIDEGDLLSACSRAAPATAIRCAANRPRSPAT